MGQQSSRQAATTLADISEDVSVEVIASVADSNDDSRLQR
jgi:hypothetical protein